MDIDHYFSGDIAPDGTSLLAMDELTASQQRIIRRILTNPGEYPSDATYGAGAGRFIGATTTLLGSLKALIVNQMYKEPSVVVSVSPIVKLTTDNTVLYINIQYVDVLTNAAQTISFNTGA